MCCEDVNELWVGNDLKGNVVIIYFSTLFSEELRNLTKNLSQQCQ